MTYSEYLMQDAQQSKFDKFRINYDLLSKVLIEKENRIIKFNKKHLSVKTVYP